MTVHKGEIMFGRYRIEGLLGQGGFGEVYLAENINLKVNRALKCIRKCRDVHGVAAREADILKNLRHPAIPIIYDIEENEEFVCIIEEYISGMSLNSLITHTKSISTRRIITLIKELCEVLEYLHKNGIYHHDIKPDNIIIDNEKIKLLDYGNAARSNESNRVRMGTAGYAAPEMYGKERIGAGSDIYSIGMVILYLATGKKNIEAAEEIHAKELRMIIDKCLCHSTEERISSVRELRILLNKISKRKSLMENVSLRISYAGTVSHCGTTHCAIKAAEQYINQGHKVLLCERNESGDFFNIIKGAKRVRQKGGIYEVNGITMIPEYYGCVEVDYDRYDIIINDYGVLNNDNREEILSADQIYLVSGGQQYEAEQLNQALQLIPKENQREIHTVINLAGVRTYKKLIKQYHYPNPVRVGYDPD